MKFSTPLFNFLSVSEQLECLEVPVMTGSLVLFYFFESQGRNGSTTMFIAAGVRCIIINKTHFVFGSNLCEKNPFAEKHSSLTRFLPEKSTPNVHPEIIDTSVKRKG